MKVSRVYKEQKKRKNISSFDENNIEKYKKSIHK